MVVARRQTASKVRVGELLKGQFIKESGELPNHVLLGDLRIGRVNIIGTVTAVDVAGGHQSILMDDGTGSILVRAFEPLQSLSEQSAGDIVCVIGRPREFNKTLYILPEIVKQSDVGWVQVRNLELGTPKTFSSPPDFAAEVTDEKLSGEHPLIGLIRKLDEGQGADRELVLAQSGMPEADGQLNRLIEQGMIFAPRPDRIKVLE